MILLGKIHWFNPDKGFGFIKTKGGEHIFVHYTAIKCSGYRSLYEGQEVYYQIIRGKRGLEALKKSHFTGLCKNKLKPAWLSPFRGCVTPFSQTTHPKCPLKSF